VADPDKPHESEDEELELEQSDERTAKGGGARLRQVVAIERGIVLADRYQIEEKLGEGGSGTVYRAWDRILGELVAIKVLHPERAREKSWIRRLAREVKLARAIRHPNVCRVFELGQAGGHWFVTLELATGGSLRNWLRDEKTPRAAVRALTEKLGDIRALSAGLAAIHAVGITHRDVTPQNVLRMADGRIVLTDFGLAIEHDDKTTLLGGTPAYLPPEVLRGERSDQRSDVFQLGMIAHEILYGVRPPWSADGTHLVLDEPGAAASSVEEELANLITECVDADAAKRPANAVAVSGRLAAAEAARPPSPVVRYYARSRRFARRHAGALRLAGGAIALAALLRAVQVASRPPLCRGGAAQLAGIWDSRRAEDIERAFAGVGAIFAADTFTRVRATLDAYTGAWTQMYTDACEATNVRGEQSAEVLDLRMACLKQERSELKATADLFATADREVVARAVSAVSALPSISRCADVAVLRAVVKPPDDPSTRARVDAIRQRLAEGNALFEAGRYEQTLALAKPLVEEARRLGYDPLITEALLNLGRTQNAVGTFDDSRASLDEALVHAEASRHDRALAEAAVEMTIALTRSGRTKELDGFAPRARATVMRIGGDLRLESWIDTNIAVDRTERGLHEESLLLNRRALEAKQKMLGPGHWDVGVSLVNIAVDLHELGRDEEAFDAIERARTNFETAFGDRHPRLAYIFSDRGEIRLGLHQPAEALSDFERALAIWKAEAPATNEIEVTSYPLTGMGHALLDLGRADDAIDPLEQALAIRRESSPESRAETAFALARALWESGRDRARARQLAKEARDLFPESKEIDRRKVEEKLTEWSQRAKTATPSPAPSRGF
jgi:tetratricopeptide (TPR) repeat protein